MNLWASTFAFVWYNDDEIFRFSEKDFDDKARQLYEDGISIVITFSCTHFRWSFRPHWDTINAALKKLVDACHKYGIQVVEHHSSHLTYGPLCEEDRKHMEHAIAGRDSSVDSWDGICDYVLSDPIIVDGMPISSFRQIDGSTGTWVRSNYHGWSMCFNNPYYRKAYFSYLETVYETGVDGIMTDDVQYNMNACTCEHCRRLFKEETGYDLPDPAHWNEFNNNYDDPAFVAWKRFRLASGERFQRAVTAHYESLGRKMLRPNYGVRFFYPNWSAYPFETMPTYWDYMFQENDLAYIIGPSRFLFTNDAYIMYALYRQGGIPCMSMFYPRNDASVYLSWVLARSVGHMYLSSGAGGKDITTWEKKYRIFEKKYASVYDAPQKAADIAFYFSDSNRDYTENGTADASYIASRIECAFVSDVQIDVVLPGDSFEVFCQMPCIMLCHVTMLSDAEIDNLSAYLRSGGRLLIEGPCGALRADGTKRDTDVAALFAEIGDAIIVPDCEMVRQHHAGIGYRTDGVCTVMSGRDETDRQKEIAAKIILPYLKTERMHVEAKDVTICPSFFKNDSEYIVHLYRSDDLSPVEPTEISHDYFYEHFAPGAVPIDTPVTVTIERCDDRAISSVKLVTPERGDEIEVTFTDDGKHITFTVPAGTFAGYLLAICA